MEHNIPCIKFSPCGKFLAASSIDKSVKIFTIPAGELLGKIPLPEWGWSVNWIFKNSVLNFQEFEPKYIK